MCHTKNNLKVTIFFTRGHITYLVSNNLVSSLFKDQQLILLVLLKNQHIGLYFFKRSLYIVRIMQESLLLTIASLRYRKALAMA
jgi:hypothetical protein